MRCVLLTTLAVALSALVCAQPALTFPPPKVNAPDEATLKAIKEKTAELEKAIAKLGKEATPDVEIYLKAARYIVRHNEFYGKQAEWVVPVIEEGLRRAKLIAKGRRIDPLPGKTTALAYRSRIDGSVQPYAVTLPHDFKKTPGRRFPLHVVLHGRDGGLTEVSFLYRHHGKAAPKGLDHVILDIYGRGNNAYRWAGEADVFDAMQACADPLRDDKRSRLNRASVVLRGFSMGGAGTWHLGLHHPDRFCVIGPGAGFTTTYGYIGGLKKLPSYQDACLHIYDAVDYAANALSVPIVAYSGADDAQKAAADNIEAVLKKLGLKMTHLVAPKTGHTIPPAYQTKLAAEYAKYSEKGREEHPKRVRFTTYTLKYPRCDWVTIEALKRHYSRAFVDAEWSDSGPRVKTENVRQLELRLPRDWRGESVRVVIDGQTVEKASVGFTPSGSSLSLALTDGKWGGVGDLSSVVDKRHDLQGPIDDAFMSSFLCVRGTGKPWNAAVNAHAVASLERFRQEWSKYFRGDIRIKDDKDVTEADIKAHHLILFGDPGSNSLIAKVMPKLPFKWSEKSVTWMGKEQDAGSHVPVLIQPNPLDPTKYVVLNSGHTFHKTDFEGTNALLYPRLGDHALLKVADPKRPLAVEVVTAGLFDEFWKFRAPEKP